MTLNRQIVRRGLFRRSRLCILLAGFACLLWGTISATTLAAPTIGNIAPPSLQIGSTVSLRIDGGDLAANPRLLLPVKIVEQSVKPGAAANQVQLDVKLDADVQPGIYLARVATDSGVSNAFPLSIDALPTTPVPTNLTQIPSAVFGDLSGGNVMRTTFNGAKDQPIQIEVEARRLGGKLNPVIRVLDQRGVQIAWTQGERRLGGDARLATKLPAAGTYTVEMHDLLFRGEGPGRFRLKIGDWKYAHLALPLGVQRGTAANVSLLGGNLDRAAVVDARLFTTGMRAAPWPAGIAASGNGPALVVSDYPELLESGPAEAAGQTLAAAPIGVSGRLAAKSEEDRYIVPVTPGQTLRLEMFAERIGSPIDGVLIVRNTGGGELARGDDQPGTTDPSVNFAVPAGVNAIVVSVSDLTNKGGNEFVYRLAVAPTAQEAFSPTVPQDVVTVPVNGRALVRVSANRAGHGGPIQLRYHGLPAGTTATGTEIPESIQQALVVLAATQAATARVSLTGEAAINGAPIARSAKAPDFPAAETQPWLHEELAIAAVGSAPLVADWANAEETLSLTAGGKATAAVKVTRSAGVTGPVRLTLITSQTVPKKNVENREIDDETKALRAEAIVVVPPEAGEGTLSIAVPGDLPRLAYDLVVQADLLSADGQQVVATTYTLPRRATIVAAPQ